MDDLDFSNEFCEFIRTTIPTVDAAELLLLYRARPELTLTAEEAVAKLGPGIRVDEVPQHLELFTARGLLIPDGSRYRFDPASRFASLAGQLAHAYERRPVTLVRVIYAFRDPSIKSFADAFKLRR